MQAEHAERRERERKARESMPEESGPPRSFNPEGYIPPDHDPEAKSSSSNVGASAKAHAAKARRQGLLHQGSPQILLHRQGCRKRRENHSIMTKAADGMRKVIHINSQFIQTRVREAKDMVMRILEDGNGTIVGLRFCYFLKKNI